MKTLFLMEIMEVGRYIIDLDIGTKIKCDELEMISTSKAGYKPKNLKIICKDGGYIINKYSLPKGFACGKKNTILSQSEVDSQGRYSKQSLAL